MALLFKNFYLWVNNVDLSLSAQSGSLNYEAESLDATKMGDGSRVKQGGLKNFGLDVTFFQKYSCVDATLFGIVGCQTSIEVRACNACSTANTNPRYSGTYLVTSYPPITGGVGDLMTVTVRFEPAGDLSRNTADT